MLMSRRCDGLVTRAHDFCGMKSKLQSSYCLRLSCAIVIVLMLMSLQASAATLKGRVFSSDTGEALVGAAIVVEGTAIGTVSDYDGNYELTGLTAGQVDIVVQYVSFAQQRLTVLIKNDGDVVTMDIEMVPEDRELEEIAVVARRNMENAQLLMLERRAANIAIENIGAKEMSAKGVSTVEEGVKKLSGISIASAGQLIVRGLGDRYSTTTLNGLPIASPNPDNKLIPLDLFPTQTVKNITVSKVYNAAAYADYSGAHVDIATKENTGENFANISLSVGGLFNTVFGEFHHMDRGKSLWGNNGLSDNVVDMSKSAFNEYVLSHDVFGSTFNVEDISTTRPDLGGGVALGRTVDCGSVKVNLLAAGNLTSKLKKTKGAFTKTINDTGLDINRFDYDSYQEELDMAALGTASVDIAQRHNVMATVFYARNACDNFMLRWGFDYEENDLTGIHSVTHIYSLLNCQLIGKHVVSSNKKWQLDWGASYGTTMSDEPDRRQVMYVQADSGLKMFKLNKQETMRYFGTLDEDELVGTVTGIYNIGIRSKLRAGAAYKRKHREYLGIRFYYNVNAWTDIIDNIYTPYFLNQDYIAAGTITVERQKQPKDTYDAQHSIAAAFIDADIFIKERWMLNVGIRYESSRQTVDYSTDGGTAKTGTLDTDDLFPALNLRYSLNTNSNIRLSLSRTVTRPSFIEMAPFLYQESYGAAQIRGNDDLDNGYNYNIDLRYEHIDTQGNMLSVTAYYKHLEEPIERIQQLAGGSAVHTFRNADNGKAYGIEIEARRRLNDHWHIGANASFMYTDVKLPEGGGAYTNSQRSLQGASPYLGNADVTYTNTFRNNAKLTAAVLYNLQGPRIDAVGISGLGDSRELSRHTLDINASLETANRLALKIKVYNILALDTRCDQEVPNIDQDIRVKNTPTSAGFSLGATIKL